MARPQMGVRRFNTFLINKERDSTMKARSTGHAFWEILAKLVQSSVLEAIGLTTLCGPFVVDIVRGPGWGVNEARSPGLLGVQVGVIVVTRFRVYACAPDQTCCSEGTEGGGEPYDHRGDNRASLTITVGVVRLLSNPRALRRVLIHIALR